MGYTKIALEDRIFEMYPEIRGNGISMSIDYDRKKNSYIIKLKRDDRELTTHLEKNDADDCMDGIKCISLGIKVGQFIKNFEART